MFRCPCSPQGRSCRPGERCTLPIRRHRTPRCRRHLQHNPLHNSPRRPRCFHRNRNCLRAHRCNCRRRIALTRRNCRPAGRCIRQPNSSQNHSSRRQSMPQGRSCKRHCWCNQGSRTCMSCRSPLRPLRSCKLQDRCTQTLRIHRTRRRRHRRSRIVLRSRRERKHRCTSHR